MIYKKRFGFEIFILIVVILVLLYVISAISITSSGISINFIFNYSQLFSNSMLINYLFVGFITIIISFYVFSNGRELR